MLYSLVIGKLASSRMEGIYALMVLLVTMLVTTMTMLNDITI